MKSILDPKFRYTPAAETDLRKTFARVRREQQRAGEPKVTNLSEPKVVRMPSQKEKKG